MNEPCSVPACTEPAVMVLFAQPSGTGKDRHLDHRFCLLHGPEYRALGYIDKTELVGVSAFDD